MYFIFLIKTKQRMQYREIKMCNDKQEVKVEKHKYV